VENKIKQHLKQLNKLALWMSMKYYFTNRVVNVWNSLPSHIVSSSTLSTFSHG